MDILGVGGRGVSAELKRCTVKAYKSNESEGGTVVMMMLMMVNVGLWMGWKTVGIGGDPVACTEALECSPQMKGPPLLSHALPFSPLSTTSSIPQTTLHFHSFLSYHTLSLQPFSGSGTLPHSTTTPASFHLDSD